MINETSKRAINILLVGPIPPPFGGIPAYVKNLKDASINGVDFMLFNTAFPEWVAPFYREGKRSYTSIFEISLWVGLKKVSYVLLSFLWLARLIIAKRPQIVHVFTCSYWGYWRNWGYILIAKFLQRKTVFHLLGAIDLFYEEVGLLQRFLLRRSLNSADCYLSQSPNLEKWVKQYSNEVSIGLWNGIDFEQIAAQLPGVPDRIASLVGPFGITIGNLSKNKGTADIIEVISRLKEKKVNLGWVFIGRGDIKHFRNLAEHHGVSRQICFTGEVEEAEKWQMLQHATFFCLPSDAEGQPISIIEAMACGLPVISTNVGSIPEVIRNGVDGILVQSGDIPALENAMLKLVSDPGLRQTMGKNSLQICRKRHDVRNLHSALAKIYCSMAG